MKKILFKIKEKLVYIYGVLFVLSVIPFFIHINHSSHEPLQNELYSKYLKKINTVDKAVDHIIKMNKNQKNNLDTSLFVRNTESFVKRRFYHGLSTYSVSENWIAYFGGEFLWSHFSAIVIPNDLLKHSEGLCSQQSMVFMEILSKRGIKTRHIGWGTDETEGHFLVEVYYNSSWHLYDVNMEPDWEKINNSIERKSMHYFLKNKESLFKAYQGRLDKKIFFDMLDNVKFGKINTYPARNMRFFHFGSKIAVITLPFLFFLLFALQFRKKLKTSK